MHVVLLSALNDSRASKMLNICFILALELQSFDKNVTREILEIGHTKSENKFAKKSCQRFIWCWCSYSWSSFHSLTFARYSTTFEWPSKNFVVFSSTIFSFIKETGRQSFFFKFGASPSFLW